MKCGGNVNGSIVKVQRGEGICWAILSKKNKKILLTLISFVNLDEHRSVI
jgi:hypothetical protein